MAKRLLSEYYGGQIDQDIAAALTLVRAEEAPLLAMLMANAGSMQPTKTREFKWYTQTLPARRTQINNGGAAYDANTTSIVVDSGAVFEPNSVILFEATGEVGLVTAVSTNTLTVVRGVGDDVAAHADSVANDEYVTFIGMAAGESSSSPDAKIAAPREHVNILQTFRKSVELSGWAMREALNTENERVRLRALKHVELLHDIERALVHGSYDSNVTGAGGARVTTTGGLRNYVDFVDNVGGTMTRTRFETFAEGAFAYGSPRKVLLAGSGLNTTLHTIYRNTLRVAEGEAAVGLRITEIVTPSGVLELVLDRSLKGDYSNSGHVIDQEQIMGRYSMGDPSANITTGMPHLRENIQEKADDFAKDEWFAEIGVKWGAPEDHSVIEGVTGAA